MKKIIGFLVVLLLLIIVLLFFARKPSVPIVNHQQTEPTVTTTTQEKPLTGESPPFQVTLPNEYKIGIFAKDVAERERQLLNSLYHLQNL